VCEEISVHELCDYVLNKATSKSPSYTYTYWPLVVDVLAALEGDFCCTEKEEDLHIAKYVMVAAGDNSWSVDLQYFRRTIHTEVSAYGQSNINSDVLFRIFYSSQDWMIQEIKKVVDAYYSTDFLRLLKLVQSEQLFDSIYVEC
jgi:hypothetical protein